MGTILKGISSFVAHDLTHMKINDKHRLITFDIKDLYVNIPTKETLKIAKTMLTTRNNKIITQQMTQLLEITLQQNYFIFVNKLYQPEKGISMGSPLSNDIVKIFLQHEEQTLLNQLMDQKTTDYYTRYVDDILVIYNTDKTNTETICNYLNTIHIIIFTPTQEQNKTINFLDLLITRKTNTLDINIKRKPTTTDTTINYYSNHPMEHKLAAYRF